MKRVVLVSLAVVVVLAGLLVLDYVGGEVRPVKVTVLGKSDVRPTMVLMIWDGPVPAVETTRVDPKTFETIPEGYEFYTTRRRGLLTGRDY